VCHVGRYVYVVVAFDKGKKKGIERDRERERERGVIVFALLGAPNLPPPPPPRRRPLVVRFQSGLACVALLLLRSKPVRPNSRKGKTKLRCGVTSLHVPNTPYPQKDPADEVARGRVIKEKKHQNWTHGSLRLGVEDG